MKDNHQKSPMISFIVPCYNLPVNLLTQCLDSILALPLDESQRELIVVDDGSETDILGQMEAYRDKLLYIRQANQGLGGARNTGLNMSSGEYVQFIDGDDLLIKDAYAHCIDLLRADEHLDMVMFEATTHATDTGEYVDDEAESGVEFMRHNNLHGSACSYVFRKTMAGQLRFTSRILHEDEEFTPQLVLRADKVMHTSARAYFYRQREQSIMTDGSSDHIRQRLDDKELVIKKLNVIADRMPAADRQAMQRRVHQLTMDYIYNIITLDGSTQELETRIERLKAEGLFPLPDKKYTKKYTWFRRMTMNKLSRRMLTMALRKQKRNGQ